MADNYLENKMDEHRRAGVRPTVSRAARTAPSVTLRLACRHILVDNVRHEAVPALMSRLSATGATVTFIDDDAAFGTRLAQSTGARFIPLTGSLEDTIAKATADRGPVEAIIACGGLTSDIPHLLDLTKADNLLILGPADFTAIPATVRANAINPSGLTPAQTASLALYLLTRPTTSLKSITIEIK